MGRHVPYHHVPITTIDGAEFPENYRQFHPATRGMEGTNRHAIYGCARPTNGTQLQNMYRRHNVKLMITLLEDDYGIYPIPSAPFRELILGCVTCKTTNPIYRKWKTEEEALAQCPCSLACLFMKKARGPTWTSLVINRITGHWIDLPRHGLSAFFEECPIKRLFLPIVDGRYPRVDDIQKALKAAQECDGAIVVHCWRGWGRTSRLIAPLIMALHNLPFYSLPYFAQFSTSRCAYDLCIHANKDDKQPFLPLVGDDYKEYIKFMTEWDKYFAYKYRKKKANNLPNDQVRPLIRSELRKIISETVKKHFK
jgi:hypothetical protein